MGRIAGKVPEVKPSTSRRTWRLRWYGMGKGTKRGDQEFL